jgi:hypothetical protein
MYHFVSESTGIIFFGGFAGPLLLLAGLKTANTASVSIWLNMELAHGHPHDPDLHHRNDQNKRSFLITIF